MTLFPESHGVTVNSGHFVAIEGSGNNVSFVVDDRRQGEGEGEGIKLLLQSCVPQAMHDSGARGDLGCHPGTREEYIRNITKWGSGEWNSKEKRAFLMTGPAGAGKSAIAQTCAHKMEASGNLAASFFFFRPGGWNDPKKFIPTIVYQLTTRYSAYRDIIDAVILDDRLVLQKAMDVQFRELLVRPLQRPWPSTFSVKEDAVIIVDGIDECATVDAQIQIIKLVTTSILEHTTPFSWAFFSRPEPPITSTFSPDAVSNISWKLPLTVSRDADSDIEAYIRGSFETIRAKYSIPPEVTWPVEEDIRLFVFQSAGLFIYAATALRYIGNSTSGIERLRSVLELGPTSTENPFSALDQLYILIMQQIPKGILFDTMSLLSLYQSPGTRQWRTGNGRDIHNYYSALGFSSASFYAVTSNLHSVLEVTKSLSGMPDVKFYHKSFIDFLFNKKRSQRYFLQSPGVIQHSMKKLVQHMTSGASVDCEGHGDVIHILTMQLFFNTVELVGILEEDILQQMSQLNWCYWIRPNRFEYLLDMRKFIPKIPTGWRRRIIRPSSKALFDLPFQILANMNPEKFTANVYIIGEGDKKALMIRERGWANSWALEHAS